MNFTQPAFLWTLAAMGIPLAIHLLSRKEGKIVKVGSLRHIEASTTSRFKSLRLNELLLLIVRCMMIAWLALFLSGATCSSRNAGKKGGWLLTEAGMDIDTRLRSLIDSITNTGFEWRTLATGFPRYDAGDSTAGGEYWNLVSELERIDRDVVVVSYNLISRFTQKRIALPENIRWITVDPPSRKFTAMATKLGSDSIAVRKGSSNAEVTSYSTSKTISTGEWYRSTDGDTTYIQASDTIRIAIIQDEKYAEDARVLKAAIRAAGSVQGISVMQTEPATADWTIWMSMDEPGRPLSVKTILLRPTPSDRWITCVDKLEWHLTKRITQDEALKDHLAVDLAEVLLGGLPSVQKAMSNDIRSLPEELSWSTEKKQTSTKGTLPQADDIGTWLIILFVATWAAERTLALSRNL